MRIEFMKILAIEPYYGGSHKAFLDGWCENSAYDMDKWTLPAHKWKWRMRSAAVGFAEKIRKQSKKYDILFCSDMFNLAEFKGLTGDYLNIPSILYFHENQLTYPVRQKSFRDYQFVFTNMTSAMAANQVWFNSEYHRDDFLDCLEKFLKRAPDERPLWVPEFIREKSMVYSPGIKYFGEAENTEADLRIVWAARWEYDKNPEDFFAALKKLKAEGVKFKVDVIGEQFNNQPDVFDWAKGYFKDEIAKWGYQPSRKEYFRTLQNADVFVSTAEHEFFGLSAVEAAAEGCTVMLPDRLAYPEIFDIKTHSKDFFYDGTIEDLTKKLKELSGLKKQGGLDVLRRSAAGIAENYKWDKRAKIFDDAVGKLLWSKKNE
jgi:glycosyltransferase involved in cell wall biosynthesis